MQSNGVTTYPDREPYHYPFALIANVCGAVGATVDRLSNAMSPRGRVGPRHLAQGVGAPCRASSSSRTSHSGRIFRGLGFVRSRSPARSRNGTPSPSPRRSTPEIADARCTLAQYSFDRPESMKMLAGASRGPHPAGVHAVAFSAPRDPSDSDRGGLVLPVHDRAPGDDHQPAGLRGAAHGGDGDRRRGVEAGHRRSTRMRPAFSRRRTRSLRSATSSFARAIGSAISGSAPCTRLAGSICGPTPRIARCVR